MRVVEGLDVLGTRFVPMTPNVDGVDSRSGDWDVEATVAGAGPPTSCRHNWLGGPAYLRNSKIIKF